MAVIDPDGLFNGDRLSRCSDKARLLWPYLFLASNGFGRLELAYHRILNTAFSTFTSPPAAEELSECVREYHDNYLLFIYESKGTVWGQWDTAEKYLPRHKSAKDQKSPAPPPEDLKNWKKQYDEDKPKTIKDLEVFPKFSEIFRENVRGVGVGVGVGGGVGGGREPLARPDTCTEEIDMRAVKQIPILSLQILGVKAERWDSVWEEVKELVAAYGDFEVSEAFETWARQKQGEPLDRPVSEFLKVAVGMLRGTINTDTTGLVDLNANLNAIGGLPFTGKYYHALAALLRKHSAKDLEAAYREYVGSLDDFGLKNAPKNFCEGGAEAILLGRKKRQKEAQQTEALIEQTKKSLQQKAQQEQEARDQAAREEAELVEDEPFA